MKNFTSALLGILITIAAALLYLNAQSIDGLAISKSFAFLTASHTPAPAPLGTPSNTEEPIEALQTQGATAAPTATLSSPIGEGGSTAANTPTMLPSEVETAPQTLIIGSHEVRSNENLYCIGRAYDIEPQAIAQANGLALDEILSDQQTLIIPNVPWVNDPFGQICQPQFPSPYIVTSTPTSTPTPQPTPTTLPATPTATPSPVPTTTPVVETRQIVVRLPVEMTLGESLEVLLSFNPTSNGGTGEVITITAVPTTTPDPERLVVPEPLQNIHHFGGQWLWATARLDAAGFDVSPQAEIRHAVQQGKPLTWHWSIKPQEAEQQTIIISLWLDYEPKQPGAKPIATGFYWSAPFVVDVRTTYFGIRASLQESFSFVIGFIGLITTTQGFVRSFQSFRQSTDDEGS